MKCKECQQLLYDYIDNKLHAVPLDLLREHLDNCPACGAVYAREKQLVRDFHETAARLGKQLHFQFRPAASLDRRTGPTPGWWYLPTVKWAGAAVLLAVLVIGVKLMIFRPTELQSDRSAQVAAPGMAVEQRTQSGRQKAQEEGLIQVISIEGAAGQLDETHYRWETDGLIAEITVEVSSPRVVRKSKG